MCLINETFKIFNNSVFNADYHNRRFNKARAELFSLPPADIRNFINTENLNPDFTYKCIIVYDNEIHDIIYELYKIKNIKSLKLIHSNDINYNYKFNNRDLINKLKDKKENCDDILIVKNGMITDTSFSNICFHDKSGWYTPSSHLLNGTTRMRLIDTGKIKEINIAESEITKFERASLINTFYDLDVLTLDTAEIFS